MVEQAPQHGRDIPANLRPYVEALGTDDAERFFLKLGGSQIFIPAGRSQERSLLFDALGDHHQIMSLARALYMDGIGGYVKVPLANEWVAERMRLRGESDNVIARTVRKDVATVRRWFKGETNRSVAASA